MVAAILEIFTSIVQWFVTSIGAVTPVFYDDGSLTLIGTVCIMSVGVGLVTLVFAWIRSLLKFRG